MKTGLIIGLLLLSVLIGSTRVMGYTIDDTYWGGLRNHLWPTTSDIAAGGTAYGIDGIDVTTNGTSMTVTIAGPFFNSSAGGAWSTDRLGDLYISPSGWHVWNTSGSINYPSDTFVAGDPSASNPNGEGWKYVVTLGGSGYGTPFAGVYLINTNSIEFTDPNFRGDQAFRGGYGTFITGATVTIPDMLHPYMSFTFDDTFLANSDNLGLHWAEECGNDVVEGNITDTRTQVPEPGSLLLLGLGISGVLAYRRRTAEK